MNTKKSFRTLAIAGLTAGLLTAGSTQAAVATITTDTDPAVDIPGLTGFQTTGAMMSGLSVTAYFSGGLSETRSWATTGLNSGGVIGAGWSLTLDGDSYDNPWQFSFVQDSNLLLLGLKLDGSTGFTVFDRTLPSFGTANSAQGLDFDCWVNSTTQCGTTKIEYSMPVGIDGVDPLYDIWHVLTIDFGTAAAAGIRTNFEFDQDTDNDSRYDIPEPASLALLGAGLLGLGFSRRRKA